MHTWKKASGKMGLENDEKYGSCNIFVYNTSDDAHKYAAYMCALLHVHTTQLLMTFIRKLFPFSHLLLHKTKIVQEVEPQVYKIHWQFFWFFSYWEAETKDEKKQHLIFCVHVVNQVDCWLFFKDCFFECRHHFTCYYYLSVIIFRRREEAQLALKNDV